MKEGRVSLPTSKNMLDHMEENEENVYIASMHECCDARSDNQKICVWQNLQLTVTLVRGICYL